jgi:hypothetical protein
MEITRSRDLAHPLDHVVAMLLDPDAHVAACVHMGHRDIEVLRSAPAADDLEVAIVRRVDVEVPHAVRRFVQPSNLVTSDDRWTRHPDGTCTGRSDVAIAGLPVRSVGVASARPAPGGTGATTYEITLAMEIGVPVVGQRVARAMRSQLERQIDAQLDAAEAWLSSR